MPAIFPITVAIAAPAVPIPKVKINIGSKTIFTIVPIIPPIIDALAPPSPRTVWPKALENKITGPPRAI